MTIGKMVLIELTMSRKALRCGKPRLQNKKVHIIILCDNGNHKKREQIKEKYYELEAVNLQRHELFWKF